MAYMLACTVVNVPYQSKMLTAEHKVERSLLLTQNTLYSLGFLSSQRSS